MSFIAKARKVIFFILEFCIFICLMIIAHLQYLQYIPNEYYLQPFARLYLLYCGLGAMCYKYWMSPSEREIWRFYPFVLSFFFVTILVIIYRIGFIIYKSSLFFCKVFQFLFKWYRFVFITLLRFFRIFFNSLERFYLGT